MRACGSDFVCVYQETYNPEKYEQVHLSGPKRIFPYRFHAQERALLGGMRGVAFGALLGLDDFRKDAFSVGVHAYLIQQKYPHAEISFSTPRLRPYINNAANNANDVHEKQLLQVMLAYRLLMRLLQVLRFLPESEPGLGIMSLDLWRQRSLPASAGVGGHSEEEKGDEQFEIADPRSVDEVHQMVLCPRLAAGIYGLSGGCNYGGIDLRDPA